MKTTQFLHIFEILASSMNLKLLSWGALIDFKRSRNLLLTPFYKVVLKSPPPPRHHAATAATAATWHKTYYLREHIWLFIFTNCPTLIE